MQSSLACYATGRPDIHFAKGHGHQDLPSYSFKATFLRSALVAIDEYYDLDQEEDEMIPMESTQTAALEQASS